MTNGGFCDRAFHHRSVYVPARREPVVPSLHEIRIARTIFIYISSNRVTIGMYLLAQFGTILQVVQMGACL